MSLLAKDYLKAIRDIKELIKVADDEITESKASVYNLHSLDTENEKVSGGKKKDISKKLVSTENVIRKGEQKKARLIEMREEARERIGALPDIEAQKILIKYCIIGDSLKKIQVDLNYSKSGFFKKLKWAFKKFEAAYGDWLEDLQVFDKWFLE